MPHYLDFEEPRPRSPRDFFYRDLDAIHEEHRERRDAELTRREASSVAAEMDRECAKNV